MKHKRNSTFKTKYSINKIIVYFFEVLGGTRMKKVFKILFSRLTITILLILIQILFFLLIVWRLSSYLIFVYVFLFFLTVVAVLNLMVRPLNPSYKMAWLMIILLLPGFGGLIYMLYGLRRISKKNEKRMEEAVAETGKLLKQDLKIMKEIEESDSSIARQATYLSNHSLSPVYKNTETEYLALGEAKFERLKEALQDATEYIFLEYFILEEGKMWGEILRILERKVIEGVKVRVLYDDIGCMNKLPYGYQHQLKEKGIECAVFNPIGPFFNIRYNNRDHRKIAIIDGYIGFTGGINLADEYINATTRFGHWKDCALYLKGEAVWNLTVMFLQVWNYATQTDEDYEQYRPSIHHPEPFKSDGYVLPYGDSPLDDEIVGEYAYLNMIARAEKYLYICTPYFIVDHEVVTALCLAAKSGVDIRMITPHIPDKWYVHILTRSYYEQLIKAGVKIFEYTPGFIHSKTFVCDDELAIIGTINLDYRSLYLHFECGVWLYQTSSIIEMKSDFLSTQALCREVSLEECQNVRWYVRLIRAILMIFAPLM